MWNDFQITSLKNVFILSLNSKNQNSGNKKKSCRQLLEKRGDGRARHGRCELSLVSSRKLDETSLTGWLQCWEMLSTTPHLVCQPTVDVYKVPSLSKLVNVPLSLKGAICFYNNQNTRFWMKFEFHFVMYE